MSIRIRIFIGILVAVGFVTWGIATWFSDDAKPQIRKATEEPLVDISRILASLAAQTAKDGKVDIGLFKQLFSDIKSQSFNAQIYDYIKSSVDCRVYITDEIGLVLFDSHGGLDEGKDYSGWRDIDRTLHGEYGARTSHEPGITEASSVMYVGSPIKIGEQIIGVLSVGKPTATANQFVENTKRKMSVGIAYTLLVTLIIAAIISSMITKPINRLTQYARNVKEGKRLTLPELGTSEVAELGIAFEEMRKALDGKDYVERYVQALTHQIKSPLAAIQGASELLEEDLPAEQRALFTKNIKNESKRVRTIVDKMLLLSSLENRGEVETPETLDLADLFAQVQEGYAVMLKAKHLSISAKTEAGAIVKADRFLMHQAVANLLENAIEFSPADSSIDVRIFVEGAMGCIEIADRGPGIPTYAQDKIFERFYSLPRPQTGQKSSGLGLSLVKEVAALHGGEVSVVNNSEGGANSAIRVPIQK